MFANIFEEVDDVLHGIDINIYIYIYVDTFTLMLRACCLSCRCSLSTFYKEMLIYFMEYIFAHVYTYTYIFIHRFPANSFFLFGSLRRDSAD